MTLTGSVLIIDQDRNGIAAALRHGLPEITVDRAGGAEDAVDRAEERAYDLFVIETNLNSMSGVNLASVLSSMNGYSDTPIIFISTIPDRVEQVLKHFPDVDVFLKPLGAQTADFVGRVKRLMTLVSTLSNLRSAVSDISAAQQAYSVEGDHVRAVAS